VCGVTALTNAVGLPATRITLEVRAVISPALAVLAASLPVKMDACAGIAPATSAFAGRRSIY
jgi:hypothetical protein